MELLLIYMYIYGDKYEFDFSQQMEQAPLKNSDILIMSCLTQTPMANPDAMIGEFCVNVGKVNFYTPII